MRGRMRLLAVVVLAALSAMGWVQPATAADSDAVVFSGQVGDERSLNGIAGARVELIALGSGGHLGEVIAQTTAGPDGRYRLVTEARPGVIAVMRTTDPGRRHVTTYWESQHYPGSPIELVAHTRSQDVLMTAAGRYVPVDPTRLFDSRTDFSSRMYDGPVIPGVLSLRTRTVGSIPDHAVAVVVNITATELRCVSSFIAAAEQDAPYTTSIMNPRSGADVANLATVKIHRSGHIALYVDSCPTHLVVDLQGYYVPGKDFGDDVTAGYVPVPPIRVADTRQSGGPLGTSTRRRVDLRALAPQDAVAVAVNVTATGATAPTSYVSAFAGGDPRGHLTSVLNAYRGQDIANLAIVPIGPDGTIEVYNNAGQTHLVLDVQGWFTTGGGSSFWPLKPRRVTARPTDLLGPQQERMTGGAWPTGVLPADASAVALNLTSTEATAATSFITAYPDGSARPFTSNLNPRAGVDLANSALLRLGPGYRVYNNAGTVRLLEDVYGYFAPSALDA